MRGVLSPAPTIRDREAARLTQVVFLLGTGQRVTLNVEDGTWQQRQPAPVLAALSERLAWNADLPLEQGLHLSAQQVGATIIHLEWVDPMELPAQPMVGVS
ncbi:hypothetical protein GCM10017784_40710 [Deinococcus indicus]|nr:hypothetical protein GCM10017784_40710 [Deinococcus indicus]